MEQARWACTIDINNRYSSKEGYAKYLVGFQRYCLFGAALKESNYQFECLLSSADGIGQRNQIRKKLYSPSDIQKVVSTVNHGMSVRKAAKRFVVPTTSVPRAVKNPEKTNLKTGPPSLLSAEVENDIVNWILYRSEKVYPVTKA